MTHKILKSVPKIALYEPDIPQNTAAIARTCSCLGAILGIDLVFLCVIVTMEK